MDCLERNEKADIAYHLVASEFSYSSDVKKCYISKIIILQGCMNVKTAKKSINYHSVPIFVMAVHSKPIYFPEDFA